MPLSLVSTKALDASGIIRTFARALTTHLNQIIVVLNTVTTYVTMSGGNITIYLDTALDAKIVYNPTGSSAAGPCIEFWVGGARCGGLEAAGWTAP